MTTRTKPTCLALLAAALLVVSYGFAFAESVERKLERKDLRESVLDVLRADGHYKIFVSALEDTGLSETIHEQGPYTIFAPTDEAFSRVSNKEELLKDKAALAAVLKCHLVPFSCIDAKNLAPLHLAMPLSSEQLDFTEVDGRIKINEASVIQSDLKAANGTAHGIDTVLMPKDFGERFPHPIAAENDSNSDGNGVFNSLKHGTFLIRKKITGGD